MNQILFLLFFFLYGCNSQETTNNSQWQQIEGRDEAPHSQEIKRHPVYRVKVPFHWKREDLEPAISLYDTTKAICEFTFEEEGEKARITIHNFPSEQLEERIPPGAQIQRWKGQFETIDPTSLTISPQAHGGYSGLLFECQGIMDGKEMQMQAWSMQLGKDHYQALQLQESSEEMRYFKQMRADYTIKATGDSTLMERSRDDIFAFARSFELIYDIPND